jgi:hypothetical protein
VATATKDGRSRLESRHSATRWLPERELSEKAPGVWLGSQILGVRAARQAHREHRTLAGLARHRNVATHHARELARDGKPEPGAAEALRGRGIGLAELLEQLCLLLRGLADAGVGDGKLDEAALTSPALVNLQALLTRLSSICRSRMGSTVNAPMGATTRRFLFCSASCPAVLMTSLISGASCTVCGLSGLAT